MSDPKPYRAPSKDQADASRIEPVRGPKAVDFDSIDNGGFEPTADSWRERKNCREKSLMDRIEDNRGWGRGF